MFFSEEQQNIIDLCKNGQNVIVDAVAGSGKTTTLLGIGALNKLTLGVLYNKSLKEETREKASSLDLTLLEVHTYHALARKYYDNSIINDNGIIAILKDNRPPLKRLPAWSRIVIDEVQDMSPLYFKLMRKVISDLKNADLRLTVMGDRFQSIYSYMGADPRFLTLADKLYRNVKGDWTNAKLSTTFRCSAKICQFINESVIGYDRMVPYDTSKPSSEVYYIHGSPFDAHRILVQYITMFLQNGYKPESIFILTTSVKVKGRDTPTRVLENALVAQQIPVYVPNDETTELSNGTMNGKLVITTFHQSKGLERDIVILYNFDNSYYYNKDYDSNILAAPLYVGVTRAKKYLFVVHDSKQPALNFYVTPKSPCVKYMTTYGTMLDSLPPYTNKNSEKRLPSRIFMASELTNYLSAEVILEALTYLNIQIKREPDIKVPLVSIVETSKTTKETVSDINGIAIPALYEWRNSGKMSIGLIDEYSMLKQGSVFSERYKQLTAGINNKEPHMSVILEMANIFSSVFSGYHYKVAQIKSYDWLKTPSVEPCINILSSNITALDTEYELHLPEQITTGACIRGQIDAYSKTQSTLWEIKCTESLDNTHLVQLAVYMWMFSKYKSASFLETSFHLLNIRTNELRSISAKPEALENMMAYLVTEKTRPIPKKTDTEFINEFTTKFESSYRQLTLLNMLMPDKHPLNAKETRNEPRNEPRNELKDEPMNANELPKPKGRTIIFDLETNGLPETPKFGEFFPPTDLAKYRTARIVQWSWALYEPDGTLIREEDHLIKPNTAEYRIMNHEIHGITEAMAREKGKTFDEVLNIWSKSVNEATTLVGHNVNFDKYILLSELHRRNFPEDAANLEKKEWICTMERAKVLCGLRARNKLKPPKLRELMHALGIEEESNRTFHNSRDDVYYTAKCYFAEQILKNSCPKMYEGKHAGLTYEQILNADREYAVHSAAVCNVRKLYTSPLRKLSNWVNTLAKTDPILKAEIAAKVDQIRQMTAQ